MPRPCSIDTRALRGGSGPGTTTVSKGEIRVSGSINGENNTYAASGEGTLTISGANGNIQNDAVTVKLNGSTDATINRATVGTSSIAKEAAATQGSLANAAIDISSTAYAIEGVAMSDSLVNLKSAGTVTLTNVTLTGTTKLAEMSPPRERRPSSSRGTAIASRCPRRRQVPGTIRSTRGRQRSRACMCTTYRRTSAT